MAKLFTMDLKTTFLTLIAAKSHKNQILNITDYGCLIFTTMTNLKSIN